MKVILYWQLGAILLVPAAVHAEEYPFNGDFWQIDAAESAVEDYLGEQAMRIKGGHARVIGLELTSGLIEYDVAVSRERGFAGAIFRVQDLSNYEHFYIRPHQSGNPDANQYTPVYNGVSAWQLYHGEGYGVPVSYRFDTWMHIKIAFAGDHAEVFIDSEDPVLVVSDLKRDAAAGGVGIGAANFAHAHFANFEASPLSKDYQFMQTDAKEEETAAGVITLWQVSEAFAEDTAEEHLQTEQSWSVLTAESTGITNLARAPGVGPGKNTVVARLRLESDTRQHKSLAFGYSDSVTVYVNEVPIYGGTNRYMSRDYRYLGTIGLFDKVYLPLEEGENEVWFVVTEAFGGWGIQAQLDDLEGISILRAR
jgi:hypothetical protein